MTGTTRRRFLEALLAGAGGAAFAANLTAQHAPAHAAAAIKAESLSDALRMLSGGGGNIVVAASRDALLLVNGGRGEHAARIGGELAKLYDRRPVSTVINTDWHPDHTGFNSVVRQSGGRVVAHEYTKQYLQRAGVKDGLPNKTFYTSEKLDFAGETIEYGQLGQAHTDGDIYVYFRGQNVLAAGDLLTSGVYPIADVASGGWLGGMATATKTLLDMTNPQTRFVPGVGPILSRTDVEAQQQMLQTLRDRIGKMMRQGMGAEDMLASGVTKDFDAKWGDPKEFVNTAYRGMWLHVRELGGIV